MDNYKPFSFFHYNDFFCFKDVYVPPPIRFKSVNEPHCFKESTGHLRVPPGFSERRNIKMVIQTDLNTNASPYSPTTPEMIKVSDETFFNLSNTDDFELEKSTSPKKYRKRFFKK